MAGLLDLPDELLVLIFSHCQHENPIPWLRASKRLCYSAMPIIYQYISVHFTRVPKLLDTFSSLQIGYQDPISHRTQSLTVHVPDYQPISSNKQADNKILQDLKAVITTMPSLTTFSMFSEPKTYSSHSCRDVDLNRFLVANILYALPGTLRSLELAVPTEEPINSSAAYFGSECSPLCSSIQALLPVLHHLRLKLPGQCPNFIWEFTQRVQDRDQPFPLQTFSISLEHCAHFWRTIQINTPQGLREVDIHDKQKRLALSADARALYTSNRFPHLKEFVVIDMDDFEP